jgi:hypothetical protein
MTMMKMLFEERHFSWPKQPGNAQREAKLPWVWFTDAGEAQTYLQLWWVWQWFTWLLILNFWLIKNHAFGWAMFIGAILAQAAFLRVWIPICRRASPRLGPYHWFVAGWFNTRSRHCLATAWDEVKESRQKQATSR